MSETIALDDLAGWRRTHDCGALRRQDVGREVCLMGWAQFRRDHGGLIFIDLRDRGGLTQVVFCPEGNAEALDRAHVLRTEYVLAVTGRVRPRPEGMENPSLPTGEIEVEVTSFKLLNTSATPPFPSRTASTPRRACASSTATSTCAGPSWPPTSCCGTGPCKSSATIWTAWDSWKWRPRC